MWQLVAGLVVLGLVAIGVLTKVAEAKGENKEKAAQAAKKAERVKASDEVRNRPKLRRRDLLRALQERSKRIADRVRRSPDRGDS